MKAKSKDKWNGNGVCFALAGMESTAARGTQQIQFIEFEQRGAGPASLRKEKTTLSAEANQPPIKRWAQLATRV